MTTKKSAKEVLKSEEFTPSKMRVSVTQGTAVKILREKNNLSQNELAQVTGLTQSTISSIENGRISLGIERAKVLARALNIHPAVIAFPDWEIAA
jgi:transcriptional regulator with XRE-family HTH domain